MADRTTQELVLALLLALAALATPVAGAVVAYQASAGSEFTLLGASGQYDFQPVLLLVGALGLLVVSSAGAGLRPPVAQAAGTVTALAAAVLAFAYVGSAFVLRPGGPLVFGSPDEPQGWGASRTALVASMLLTGALCAAVFAYAARWLTEPTTR